MDGLRAWYEHTDAAPPTPAEVEQTIMLAGDRELTAADWTAIFKLGSRRLSIVLGVLMNHLDAPTDDEQVTDALRMLSPAAPSPVKRIRPCRAN